MVNQQFKRLVLVISFILFGCVSESPSMVELDHPTPTVVIPTSTSVPTGTKTLTPTATLIDTTSTPYLTPFLTLSAKETFNYLFMSENKCNMPCWWGIIPGKSTWPETRQFIEQFSELSFGVKMVSRIKPITKASSSETYVWTVGNPVPNTDSATTIYLDVQDNLVAALEIGPELVWNFFPIDKLLVTYGVPNQILIGDIYNDANSQMIYARIYLLYTDERILTSYGYSGSSKENSLKICLYDYSEGYMYMWSYLTDLDFDFSKLTPLEEYLNLDTKSFYDMFKDDKNRCLEISKDKWE